MPMWIDPQVLHRTTEHLRLIKTWEPNLPISKPGVLQGVEAHVSQVRHVPHQDFKNFFYILEGTLAEETTCDQNTSPAYK